MPATETSASPRPPINSTSTARSVNTWPSALACLSVWELRRLAARVMQLVKMHATTARYFSRPTGASLEITSRPELDETILDHVALSASGLKCEVTIPSLEDLDPQGVTQECRSNEPNRHTADSARITVGYRVGCGASAEGIVHRPWRKGASNPLRRAPSRLKWWSL